MLPAISANKQVQNPFLGFCIWMTDLIILFISLADFSNNFQAAFE